MSQLSGTWPEALRLGATALVRAGAAVVGLERDEPKQVAAVLHFPGDLVAPQVRTVLDGVAGLPRGAVVALGMLAEPSGITFELSGAASQLTVIERTLAGTAPGVRLDALAASAAARRQPGPATRGARLSWQGAYPLLRTDEPESTIGALLGTVSQLRQGERLWLQLALTPAGRVPLPAATDSGSDDLAQLLGAPRHVPREQRRAVVAKFHLPLLRARIMLAVQAGHPSRAEQLITRVAGVLRTRSGMRGGLRVRRLPAGRLLPSWSRPPRGGDLLSSAELIALVGWPIGAPALPGLNYGVAPRLLPPAAIPSEGAGRVFGVSNWPGQERRRLIQPPSGARCHSLLLGPSGSGKSWLLANLFLGQLAAGEGAVLLDLKGDTASDVLKRIAPERHGDVWLLEPSNGLPVPGLRCFSGEPELAADLWLNIFRGLFSDSWGVRSERYLRLAFTTLANDAGASVADAPRLFGDARYRRRLVGALTDPLLLGQWAEFEALGSAQRAEHLASPLGKVSELVGRRVVRSVLAQAEPKLTIRDAIERGRIIVVSLPPGRLGGPAAQLLGALAVYEVFGTIMARQALAPERRRPMGFYIDEPAVLGSLPVPLDSLFETARGMGCGLTIAAQSLSQLPTAVQRAATTNAATIAAFRPGAEDAARVARELPGLTAEQLQQLDPYTVALRLGVAPGQVAPVCTVRALPLPEAVGDANALRRISSERYGTDPAAVDAALRARHDLEDVASSSDNDAASSGSASSPLGERRRAS